jgi:hypothetical protein
MKKKNSKQYNTVGIFLKVKQQLQKEASTVIGYKWKQWTCGVQCLSFVQFVLLNPQFSEQRFVYHCLSFFYFLLTIILSVFPLFSFDHCIVCLSSIFFWPLYCLSRKTNNDIQNAAQKTEDWATRTAQKRDIVLRMSIAFIYILSPCTFPIPFCSSISTIKILTTSILLLSTIVVLLLEIFRQCYIVLSFSSSF